MNKKVLLLVIFMVLAIVGGITFLAINTRDKTAEQQMTETEMQSSNQPTSSNQETANSQPGTYIDYSPSVIANTTGTKLLFFHAPWCPQCRAIEEDINSQGVPSNVTIIKVDYDSNQELRQKYGVTIQTTFVKIDDSGELISKFVAYKEPTLDSVKQNLL